MLKKNDYYGRKSRQTCPVVALAQVDTELGKATFHIGVDREAIMQGDIIETRTMFLTFDRNVNPYEYAYTKAKEQRAIEVLNKETHMLETKLVDGIFTEWEDLY